MKFKLVANTEKIMNVKKNGTFTKKIYYASSYLGTSTHTRPFNFPLFELLFKLSLSVVS